MKTIKIVYGIIFPLLCVILLTMLIQLNYVLIGLMIYTLGVFIWYQMWFNIVKFIDTLNS